MGIQYMTKTLQLEQVKFNSFAHYICTLCTPYIQFIIFIPLIIIKIIKIERPMFYCGIVVNVVPTVICIKTNLV